MGITHKDDGFEFSILFCPECGTSIYAEPHIPRLAGVVIIQVCYVASAIERA